MARTVDELILEIKAEPKSLRKGLDGVQSQLKRTNAVAKSSVLTFGNLSRIFAAIGFTRLVGGVIRTTRQFEDLRATLQANTGSLKETNEAFDLILDFTATTTFQIEQVTQAFIEFRRLGISPTRQQLQGIGNVAAAQQRSIDEVALAIFRGGTTSIEQLQSLGFTAKTTGDTMEIAFGQGSDAIRDTIGKNVEEVLDFVAMVGDLRFSDAIIQRAKTLTGAISNLGDRVSVFQNQIGEAGLKQATIDLALTFNELLRQGGESGLSNVLGEVLGGAVNALRKALLFANQNAEALRKVLVGLFAIVSAKLFISSVGSIAIMFTQIATAAAKAKVAINGVKTALLATSALAMANPMSAAIVLGTAVLGGSAIAMNMDRIKEQVGKIMTDLSDLFTVPEVPPVDEVGDGTSSTTTTTTNETKKLTEAQTQLQEAVVASSQAFTKNFVDSLLEGQNALASFRNFAKNIVSQIITIFLQMEVVNRILASIFPQLGIEFGGIVSGAGGGTKKIPEEAGGGTVQPNMPVLVGERGAEIFVPNSSGRILNNMNSMNMLGGGQPVVINQSLNFATGVVPTVRAEVQALLPTIAEVSKGAVLESAMRGGAYQRGLRGG